VLIYLESDFEFPELEPSRPQEAEGLLDSRYWIARSELDPDLQ
jgi:hypothetical protein